MKTIEAVEGQTLFDIAIQELGSPEGVFDILKSNAYLRLDMALEAGQVVFVPDAVIKPAVVDYYARNEIKPVSGTGETITLNNIDMVNLTQTVNYDLSDGDYEFEWIRIPNLAGNLTVQINHEEVSDALGEVWLEQSLDGVSGSAIEGSNATLGDGTGSDTINLTNLLTNYVRVILNAPGITGQITSIKFRV